VPHRHFGGVAGHRNIVTFSNCEVAESTIV
jgi:hypothetical protein